MNRRATIKEVAAQAGVSIATVSNVFSGNRPVNADLALKVMNVAAALDYRPDRVASQLRSGQARVVGILVPDLDDVFFTSLVSRIEVMARKDGYDVIITSSRDDAELEASRLRALLGWRLSGLIAVPCSDQIPALLQERDGLAVVLVDRLSPGESRADAVMIDNAAAGALAAGHLIDRGHERITIAASNLAISPIRERVRGAAERAARDGLPAPQVVELGSSATQGAEAFVRWLDAHPAPEAIFALTNVTTLAVLGGLARKGIDVPEQCSLIGFDDYPWMSARKTPLTAIGQPLDEMAEATWQALRQRMAGETAPPRLALLSADLQIRASVRGGHAEGEGRRAEGAIRPD